MVCVHLLIYNGLMKYELIVLLLFALQKDFFQLKELEKIAPKEKGISKLLCLI